MTTHSIASAKDKLSELIDRALKGEDIVITRHGRPVVKLGAITAAARTTDADLDWLAARRKGRRLGKEDAGTLVSRMRDEDWR
ncbi:MAG: type II toxin-antitoxin system Phd/YefM family antitoxin [Rhizomicrobium sp.]